MKKTIVNAMITFQMALLGFNQTAEAQSQQQSSDRAGRISALLERQQNGRATLGGVLKPDQLTPRGFYRPINPQKQLPHFRLSGFENLTVTFKEGAYVSVLKSHLIQARNSVLTNDETGRTIRDPSDLLRTVESLERAIKTLEQSAQNNGKLARPISVELHLGEVLLKQGEDLRTAIQKYLPEIQIRNVEDVRVATRTMSPKRTADLSEALARAESKAGFARKSKAAVFLSLGASVINNGQAHTYETKLD